MRIMIDVPSGTYEELRRQADALNLSIGTLCHYYIDRSLTTPLRHKK